MELSRVELHTAFWPQERPLSYYQRADTIEWLLESADMGEIKAWLAERGVDVKVDMYKVTSERERFIRCILYAEMPPGEEMMLRLTFGI